mmetsp:Transcript_16340/g.23330  ORF Transcript_16340/g.23330 Transcript_16340/m.23330 type:complete len:184 (+) Transcript_16340:64-615(+)|eukprot:CAMPEP_0172413960 /NCGR_PEP_ID=MMETSP1064-20121228/547_1 /TAXON_ID=202472 /ORGANISM="Aulacoseira subarctica , Strain CCAP 1002/5" /LENGTH=183 /DNA_ID=CAMNT_0013150397 /DNA_START=58 /DNA_END=609 /DNA_ORIENTATION=+
MKLVLVATLATAASAFAPVAFTTRSSCLQMVNLDYGKQNSYVPAKAGDGGQGTFGAVSPSNWRVPGTSPIGEKSYAGASDGGDEPWFSEAQATVFLDLKKADETLKAFTKSAADFKIAEFAKSAPYGWTTPDAAMNELVAKLGYSQFLEASDKQLKAAWETLHPDPAAAKAAAAAPEAPPAAQ